MVKKYEYRNCKSQVRKYENCGDEKIEIFKFDISIFHKHTADVHQNI